MLSTAGPIFIIVIIVGMTGSLTGQCDELTGQCDCREQVEGRRCQRWNIFTISKSYLSQSDGRFARLVSSLILDFCHIDINLNIELFLAHKVILHLSSTGSPSRFALSPPGMGGADLFPAGQRQKSVGRGKKTRKSTGSFDKSA